MNSFIGNALTAAGVTYDIADFRNPQLDQLTPIQVDKSGRVFGHLAGWRTRHIGYGDRVVNPPKSPSNYKYFHQGLVPTTEGDLPVGHLTLGTGHAGQGNAVEAAAHYDNTGSQVASVRAGEDAHGIWIAGRMLPTADDLQRQTLRRSSLSGDWRKIDGQFELVAALAVNVPGFPIPRTEQLVASGGDTGMLVAAGIVRNGPITRAEVESMVTAAAAQAQGLVEAALRRRDIQARARGVLTDIAAAANARRRDMLIASGQRTIARIRREDALARYSTLLADGAAAINDATGHMPSQLHRYWTSGEGLARWATTPTPYRSLVSALTQEVEGMTPEQIKGLAANLYHDVFGTWPGRQSKDGGALHASAAPMPSDDARAWLALPDTQALLAALPIPDPAPAAPEVPPVAEAAPPRADGMIALLPAEAGGLDVGGEPVDELHLTLAYLGDEAASLPEVEQQSIIATVSRMAEARQPIDGDLFARAEFNAGSTDQQQCAVWLVNGKELGALHDDLLAALGDRVPPSDYGTWVPHITAGYDMAADRLPVGVQVTFDRVRIAFGGVYTDVPLGAASTADDMLVGEPPVADVAPVDDEALPAAGGPRRAQTQEGADKYGVSIGDVIGKHVDDAVDSVNNTAQAVERDAQNVAKAVGEAIFGKRKSGPSVDGAKSDPNVKSAKPVENKIGKGTESSGDKLTDTSRNVAKSSTPAKAAPAATPPLAEAAPAKAAKSSTTPPTIPADAPAPRKDVGAGTDHPMEEDESPDKGALGGKLISYGDGRADYDDGSWTDGNGWHVGDPPQGTPDQAATRAPADSATSPDTSPPNVEITATDVPPRQDVGAGTDHPMNEDESPLTGAEGGELVEFGDGVATYSDGTQTDGNVWTRSPVLPGMGYDGQTMLEDQSPLKGAEGGDLVSYGDGVAVYSDGTQTDGKQWTRTAAVPA